VDLAPRQARAEDMLLPGDVSDADELDAEAVAEKKRQLKSRQQRENAQIRLSSATTAAAPSQDELHRVRVYVDGDLRASDRLPSRFSREVASREALELQQPYSATVFIAANPWAPVEHVITWIAVLKGAWILTPTSFMRKSETALKFNPAVMTKRKVWVSDAVRVAHPEIWRAMLEVLDAYAGNKWTLLHSPEEYAEEKVFLFNKNTEVVVKTFSGLK